MLEPHFVVCPYCGEENEVEVDRSAGRRQAYVEDCQVCCRPWQVRVKVDAEGEIEVRLLTEDEAESG
jgi:transposase-like protein